MIPSKHRRHLRSMILAGLLGASVAVSQVLAQGPANQGTDQGTSTLRGVVEDSLTHQPIARVLVDSPSGGSAVLTDSAGHFAFASAPLGTVRIGFRRPGYFDPLTGTANAGATVQVTTDTPEQTLLLEPGVSLRGQLMAADGDSPAGLHVNLYVAHVVDGHRRWQVAQNTIAHGDGSFLFDDMVAGSFLVHAEASLDPVPSGSPTGRRPGYAPVFGPATGDMATATVLTLLPGQTGEARLQLSRVPFYPVTIRIASDVAARSFEIMGNGFTSWAPRYDRTQEAVTTELPPGNYVLRGRSMGRQPVFGEVPFNVGAAPFGGATLVMSGSGVSMVDTEVVASSTEEASGAPGMGASGVRSGVSSGLNSLQLFPLNSELPEVYAGVQTDAATGRQKLVSEVPPGQYWVSGVAYGGYLAALSSGGVDLLREPLTVTPGTSPSFRATIRQDGGTLTVTREGTLANQACVIQLVPLSPGGVASVTVAGANDGVTSTGNLPPGDYLVLATASRQMVAFREAGVLSQLHGTRVTVTAGGSAQAVVSSYSTLPPGSTGAP